MLNYTFCYIWAVEMKARGLERDLKARGKGQKFGAMWKGRGTPLACLGVLAKGLLC